MFYGFQSSVVRSPWSMTRSRLWSAVARGPWAMVHVVVGGQLLGTVVPRRHIPESAALGLARYDTVDPGRAG